MPRESLAACVCFIQDRGHMELGGLRWRAEKEEVGGVVQEGLYKIQGK